MNRNVGAWESYSQTVSAAIPGVVPGSYYVIVRSDIRNQIPEADEGNNLGVSNGTLAIDMIAIPLNGQLSNQLVTGTEHYYRVGTPTGEVLSIKLDSTAANGSHELFTRFGQVPTRAQWEFAGLDPFSPDQQVLIPETQSGSYFNIVRGQNVPNPPAAYTIRADLVPFGIASVSPIRIGDSGQVTLTIKGARFQPGAIVTLQNTETTLYATVVLLLDSTRTRARFYLTNALHGIYAVTLRNPSGEVTSLPSAVTIETTTGPLLLLQTSGGLRPRVGQPLSAESFLSNRGNVDASYVLVSAMFSGNVTVISDFAVLWAHCR